MKNTLIPAVILGLGMLMLACSGSDLIPPTPPPPGPGPGSGPILNLTDEERIAALNECGTFADALGDLKLDATRQLLVTYLKSRGEFAEADAENGNVWARFHDGRLAMFIPDWLSANPDGGRLPVPDISEGRTPTENGQRFGVPDAKKVMSLHGLGNAFEDNRPYLSNIFSKSHTRYVVESKEATIENLKSVKDVDVFYFDTHGGFGRVLAMNSSLFRFSLWTSDSVSVERENTFRSALDSKELTYMYALEDRGVLNWPINEWHYGITEKFVYEHMSFTENSLIYIDACNSLTSDASGFQQMMMGRAVNATTYIGWTGVTDDDTGLPTSRFIFDRLLGAPVYMLEAPPQRPFDLGPIMLELFEYNLGLSRYGGKLAFESSVEGEIMLAPSIEYITVDDYYGKMSIHGLFGDNSMADGKVTVGGQEVNVPIWGPYLLICDLPATGAGSSGNVIVNVNGHESNIVPLSEWTIPIHIEKDEFGLKLEANINLKIRADVHKYRSKPEEIPKVKRPEDVENATAFSVPVSAGSSGSYTTGGQRSVQCTMDDCTIRDTESSVTQRGELSFIAGIGKPVCSAYYKWSEDLKKISVELTIDIPEVAMRVEFYTACEAGTETSSHDGTSPLGFVIGQPGYGALEFKLDANFNIEPGNIPPTQEVYKWGRCGQNNYIKQSITWPTVTPTVRPNADTESRVALGE